MRLIDADDVLKKGYGNTCYINSDYIRTSPTIDAVPVVRCKDCEHAYWLVEVKNGKTKVELNCKKDGRFVAQDDYCSWGERNRRAGDE